MENTLLQSPQNNYPPENVSEYHKYIKGNQTLYGDRNNNQMKNGDSIIFPCIDRQIVKTSIENGKPSLMCFINLTGASEEGELIAYQNFTISQISVSGNLTQDIPIVSGMRQRDYLTPSRIPNQWIK